MYFHIMKKGRPNKQEEKGCRFGGRQVITGLEAPVTSTTI
jgi:hypothetical protein